MEGGFEEQHLFIYLLIYLLNRPIEKLFIPLKNTTTRKTLGNVLPSVCPAPWAYLNVQVYQIPEEPSELRRSPGM